MSHDNKELEVKFYVNDLEKIEEEVVKLGGRIVQSRVQEYNLRFDTPDERLTRSIQVLRLRQDNEVYLTYKGPGLVQDGVRLREEIEVKVSSFENTRSILEALGYQIHMIYEKYRAIYALDNVLVTLDELPYGNFVEIEGPDGVSILGASIKLGLNWDARAPDSYALLFNNLRNKFAVSIDSLTFSDFTGIDVTPEMLGVRPADE